MKKQKFNQPEINVTPINGEDIIRTSDGEVQKPGIELPDDVWG